jgi:hypothetical protein
MLAVVLVAAGLVSVFRVFTAARDHFVATLPAAPAWQAAVVGISAFILAEFMVITSVVSARVFFTGRARWIFAVPATLGLAMAIVGNAVITKPQAAFSLDALWSLLETLAPPVAALFAALIIERLVLDAIQRRHASERAYQEAIARWQEIVDNIEHTQQWRAAYATALREVLRETNARGRGATERIAHMEQMTDAQWREAVTRELEADAWWETHNVESLDANPTQTPTPAPTAHHNGATA